MNQDFIEGQTDLELVEVDSVVDSLSTWIELGAEGIVTFFSSDEVSDVLDEIKELLREAGLIFRSAHDMDTSG